MFEFEDPEAAQHFHTNRIDLWRLLCFHHKESNRYHSKLPPFVSKDELMGVDFDIRLLDTAESVGLLYCKNLQNSDTLKIAVIMPPTSKKLR